MYQVDIFIEQESGDPLHFERKWVGLPERGDHVAVETRDDATGAEDMHVGVVTKRAFISEDEQTLRVQLTVTPEALLTTRVVLAGVGETEDGSDTL